MATDTETSESQARAQIADIVWLVARIRHAVSCDDPDNQYGGCSSTLEEMNAQRTFWNMTDIDIRAQYHDEDQARDDIHEDALDVQVRSDWHNPNTDDNTPTDYLILLCTGGPAVRIIGELDDYQEPKRARIEHQDWGTPWTELVWSVEMDTLLEYARQFYFGA